MNDPMHLPDDLNSFAKQLGQFAALSNVDRDAVMFAAGQSSAAPAAAFVGPSPRGTRYWQGATVTMGLLSACLAVLLVLHPTPEPRIVVVERYLPSVSGPPAHEPANSREPQHEAMAVAEDEQPGTSGLPSGDELANAWKARQTLIANSGKVEFRPEEVAAANRRTAWNENTRIFMDQPLTGASFLPGRSRDAVSRSLEERL